MLVLAAAWYSLEITSGYTDRTQNRLSRFSFITIYFPMFKRFLFDYNREHYKIRPEGLALLFQTLKQLLFKKKLLIQLYTC